MNGICICYKFWYCGFSRSVLMLVWTYTLRLGTGRWEDGHAHAHASSHLPVPKCGYCQVKRTINRGSAGSNELKCRVGLLSCIYYTVNDCIFGDFPAKNTIFTPYIYTYVYGRPRYQPTLPVSISSPPNSKPPISHPNANYLMLYLNHWHLLEIWHSGGFCGARCVFCTHFGRGKVFFWGCPDRPLLQDISIINVI